MTPLVKGSTDPRALLAELPDDTIINAREFATTVGISVRHLDRLLESGSAPKPIGGLGRQVRRWRMGAVREWLRAGQVR